MTGVQTCALPISLQDKVRTSGKLTPWLQKHGLSDLQELWSRLHIQTGWENALEAALRERMNALEVGRLETVRAFANDAPPAKLSFYTLPLAATPGQAALLPRMADLLNLHDSGLKALLTEWLQGCYTAPSHRLYTAHGHTVTRRTPLARAGTPLSAPQCVWPLNDSELTKVLGRLVGNKEVLASIAMIMPKQLADKKRISDTTLTKKTEICLPAGR